ncbi:MAG: hypothetical protein HYX34_11715 [Actinobacteria bacterium]|nr:hypothetical protein [Actinomycetota bacterium]
MSRLGRLVDVVGPRSEAWRRRRLLLTTIPAVLAIVAVKLAVGQLGWEFLKVSPLHTSVVAGALFIVGLLLAGTVSDYKESERLATEITAAMENIYREASYLAALHPELDLVRIADTLADVPHTFRDDLVHGTQHTIATVERLTEDFLQMERIGVSTTYINRLKQEQAAVIRSLLRAGYIQRIAFLPSAYTLVETIVVLLVILLLFTKVESRTTDAVILGVISLVFLYILRLLRLLDAPFRAERVGLDDISLFQIDAIHDRMHERLDRDARAEHEGEPTANP